MNNAMLWGMKTSTIMWTLAALIILLGAGAYWYSDTPNMATSVSQTEIPNPSGTNLPAGDFAPVTSTAVAGSSTTASVNASTSVGSH